MRRVRGGDHKIREYRSYSARLYATVFKAVCHSVGIFYIKFVVIVPSGVYSVVQKLCRNIVVPKLKAFGQSKINVTAHTVPKLGYKRCAVFILYKKPFFGYFVVHRVRRQKGRLDIGYQVNFLAVKTLNKLCGVREFIVIPIKNAPQVADGGIARGQIKSAAAHI